jgi:hypothetical protein
MKPTEKFSEGNVQISEWIKDGSAWPWYTITKSFKRKDSDKWEYQNFSGSLSFRECIKLHAALGKLIERGELSADNTTVSMDAPVDDLPF